MPTIKTGGTEHSTFYQKSFIFHCDNCGSYLELSGKEVNEARKEGTLSCIGCGGKLDVEKYNCMFRRFRQ